MWLRRLWLTDFRCYESAALELPAGCTVVTGANGQGKTSLLEAIDWIATQRSFRNVPDAALVRSDSGLVGEGLVGEGLVGEGAVGERAAILRAELSDGERELLVECEIRSVGRNRVLVNKQALTRRRDRTDLPRVTIFSPDDLTLVKGPPAGRRAYLDDLLVATVPRFAGVRTDVERVLRQRNALLRGGTRGPDDITTLDVLDARFAQVGAELVRGRLRLAASLQPEITAAYGALARGDDAPEVFTRYEAEWAEGMIGSDRLDAVEGLLLAALGSRRRQEIERRTTLAGPHRDEWRLSVHGLDARTHASQGEQRTLALALRLGGHRVIRAVVGAEPLLLLDDVFSELDPQRSAALVEHLPETQTILTTAGPIPAGVHTDAEWRVDAGHVTPAQ